MLVTLSDGYRMAVEEEGECLPLIVLHGGPGMDHTAFRPYLDPLGEDFRLLYVDERGQGRSDRVDPTTLSLRRLRPRRRPAGRGARARPLRAARPPRTSSPAAATRARRSWRTSTRRSRT